MKRTIFNSALVATLLATAITPAIANSTQAADNNNVAASQADTNNNNQQIDSATAQAANQASNNQPQFSTKDQQVDPTVSPVAPTATPAVSTKSVTTSNYASPQSFIQQIAPYAQQSANNYGLYPSVMMAQAILESGWGSSTLSQAPNYNLFGIKGSYNGASVSMPTLEWINGGYVTVNANFRKYPSYLESFNDNGDKLRNGISGAPDFYKGTWRENTSSYKDATAWLQGRYATDPSYASKLNNIIQTYNLTQYDGSSTTGGSTGTATEGSYVVRITNVDQYANMYDDQGQLVDGPVLLKNTDWKSDKLEIINGVQYFRVSTHLWVKALDVTRIK
ncbi:glycoside hydrolase family 73 protein [Bombilactobacillus thymidiniphilus]|uniref:glycoside hydrolase family 73 protein n=1 Tax=Bombilactobacillus thymidiniphilus TaxID=2923363 RepID=UPI00294FF007|nr:glucosaminidase domain-containing protein [Bombilactobacillus thymidiniphilus]